jgi:hypothetical protein
MLDHGADGCGADQDEELSTRDNVIAGLGLSGRHRKIAADLHSLAPGIGRLAPHVNLGRSITHFDLTAWYVPNGEGSRLAEKRLSPLPIQATRRAMCGRLRVGKENLHVAGLGRCSHVFGL